MQFAAQPAVNCNLERRQKMNMKIGARLLELRKKKGLTQDQLAERLGVSAPAVSKWETDNSYPDITLLCPLARALDTNVDTLLQFEATLPDDEAVKKVNAIVETSMKEGYETGEEMLSRLLREFPNSVALKFNAAVVWDVFQVYFPTAGKEEKERWCNRKKELLTEVRASGNAAYWQTATLQLANIAIKEENLERAERLLKELPEHNADSTLTWSLYYLKKEEPTEALRITQKRLFSLVRQVQGCLTNMMNREIISDNELQLEICEAYKTLDVLFGLGGMYDGLFLEVYLRMNRLEEAADCLARYVDALLRPLTLPKQSFFTPGLDVKEASPASRKELRKLLLKGLEEETQYEKLIRYPKGKQAVEKLKASL